MSKDFKCKDCEAVEEKWFENTDHYADNKHRQQCGTCGGEMTPLPSACGLAFKGSGFYVNDYKGR